jgi:hypothetical protein
MTIPASLVPVNVNDFDAKVDINANHYIWFSSFDVNFVNPTNAKLFSIKSRNTLHNRFVPTRVFMIAQGL